VTWPVNNAKQIVAGPPAVPDVGTRPHFYLITNASAHGREETLWDVCKQCPRPRTAKIAAVRKANKACFTGNASITGFSGVSAEAKAV
jgi:hypothetical protein